MGNCSKQDMQGRSLAATLQRAFSQSYRTAGNKGREAQKRPFCAGVASRLNLRHFRIGARLSRRLRL
jgi:hypothetical protein